HDPIAYPDPCVFVVRPDHGASIPRRHVCGAQSAWVGVQPERTSAGCSGPQPSPRMATGTYVYLVVPCWVVLWRPSCTRCTFDVRPSSAESGDAAASVIVLTEFR